MLFHSRWIETFNSIIIQTRRLRNNRVSLRVIISYYEKLMPSFLRAVNEMFLIRNFHGKFFLIIIQLLLKLPFIRGFFNFIFSYIKRLVRLRYFRINF